MRPSARKRMRSAIAAACGVVGDHHDRLAVVVDRRRAAGRGSRRWSCESRLPVGSSANRTVGRVTSARAMATRCCWPPESSDGPVRAAVGEADRRRSARRPTPGRASRPRSTSGSVMFSSAVSIGSRLKNWKTKPMWSRRSCVSSSSSRLGDLVAVDRDGARGRAVEAGEDVHQRRLAGAGRAHDGGELPARDLERDAAQGVDGGVALAVAAA